MDSQAIAAPGRMGEQEVGERWIFLGPVRLRDVDRDAARRQAVLRQCADRAEVRRAEKCDPVVLLPRKLLLVAVAAFLEAETSEARAFRQQLGRASCRERVCQYV